MVSARVKRGTLSASQAKPTWLSGTFWTGTITSLFRNGTLCMASSWKLTCVHFSGWPWDPKWLSFGGHTSKSPAQWMPPICHHERLGCHRQIPSFRASQEIHDLCVHDGLSYIPCPVQSQRGGGGGGGGSDIAPETRGKAVLHFVRGALRTDKITNTKSFCCCKGHIEPLSSSHGNGVFGRLSHNERSEMLKLSQTTAARFYVSNETLNSFKLCTLLWTVLAAAADLLGLFCGQRGTATDTCHGLCMQSLACGKHSSLIFM